LATKMRKMLFILLLFTQIAKGQGLSPERVQKIKEATVQIFVNNIACGTGFFISNDGAIATCWHVIKPSLYLDSLASRTKHRRIYITTLTGDTIDVGIANYFWNKGANSSILFDHCILVPIKPLQLKKSLDRKSTRLNSSHVKISYAVFCLKKK